MLRLKLGLLILVTLVMTVLVILHLPGLNGPWYWKWGWRSLSPGPVYAGMLLAAVPILGAQWIDRRRAGGLIAALSLLMVGCLGMKLAAAASRTDIPGLGYILQVVENPHITAYYTDAARLSGRPVRDWMGHFPELMQDFHVHAQTKPPGPILYWYFWIRLLGLDGAGAMIGGIVLGAIATVGIPATWLMLRHLLDNAEAAFAGASFLALCPGFVLFFPMMDPTYILLSTALIGTWSAALRKDRIGYAALTGLAVAAALIIAFNVLVIGFFMIGLVFLSGDRPAGARVRVGMKQALAATGVLLAAMLGLWLALNYNPLATFASAWVNQHALLASYAEQRPFPDTILFDLTDFALGTGWIGFLLVIYYFAEHCEGLGCRLALLAAAQLLVVAITGLLQSETSRVWNFMLPLLMIPAGLELAHWPRGARIACYAAMALLTAALYQNMTFLY